MSDARIKQYEQGGCLFPQTGATQYHVQLELPDKGLANKGLDVCNDWDLEPLNLGCYQPSPEVCIIVFIILTLMRFEHHFLPQDSSQLHLQFFHGFPTPKTQILRHLYEKDAYK